MTSACKHTTFRVLRQILFTFAGFCTPYNTRSSNGLDFYEGSGHVRAATTSSDRRVRAPNLDDVNHRFLHINIRSNK
jgi:hypothetical protein